MGHNALGVGKDVEEPEDIIWTPFSNLQVSSISDDISVNNRSHSHPLSSYNRKNAATILIVLYKESTMLVYTTVMTNIIFGI